jgi:hypothetical protein
VLPERPNTYSEAAMSEHETKLIKFEDQQAEIDVDIADLVLNLWKLGLRTSNSCQDGVPKGFAWIEFCSAWDAEMFLNLVAEYSEEPGSVYDRMTRAWGDETPLDWRYDCYRRDFGVNEEELNDHEVTTSFSGTHDFRLSISVRFPRKDLHFVKQQIWKAVARQNERARIAPDAF